MTTNNLNINTANFAKNKELFFLDDPALFLDFHDGNGQVSIGYLEAEKIFRQTIEYAMFATGIPKTEVRRDPISQEFVLESTIKQFQKETLALATQRKVDRTDATYDRVIMGSEIPAPVFPSAVLVGVNVAKEEVRLWIRVLQITAEDLEITFGGDDYSNIPFKGTAQIDDAPLTTNPTWPYNPAEALNDNIAFFTFTKEVQSS